MEHRVENIKVDLDGRTSVTFVEEDDFTVMKRKIVYHDEETAQENIDYWLSTNLPLISLQKG